MPPQVILELVSGPIQGQRFSFDRHDTFLCGRHKDCHARIANDTAVSRHHFILEVNPPAARIRDLGSRNGTFVNGVKCGGRAKHEQPQDAASRKFAEIDLKHGDQISVGRTTIAVRIEVPKLCVECGAELPPPPCNGIAPSSPIPVTQTELAPGISKDSICDDCRSKPGGLTRLLKEAAKKPNKFSPIEVTGYEVGGELGRGGMGMVYKALRQSDRQNVAVKVMLAKVETSKRARDKFLREIDVIRQLEHPNIVRMLQTGPVGIGFYFVMEFCNAGSLDRLVAREGGKMRPGIAVQIMRQCLHGLEHAHVKSFVHRDIKPQNILLDKQNGRWRVKIADFGLAKDYAAAGFSGMTATGSYGGTYAFMPREQLTQFKHVRPVSDIWSMAATFYYMLTGKVPLNFSDDRDPIAVILNTKAVPIRKRAPTIPMPLATVIDRALLDDPAARFQTASEFRSAIESCL